MTAASPRHFYLCGLRQAARVTKRSRRLVLSGLLVVFLTIMVPGYAVSPLTFFAVDYPPYDIEKPTDGRRGFDVEVVEEVFRRLGIEGRVEFTPWKRALTLAESGEAAGVVSCADVPDRRSFLAVSDVLSTATPAFVLPTRHASPHPKRFADLHGRRVVATHGYSAEKTLAGAGIPYFTVWSDSAALRAVVDGRADVFYGVRENAAFLARSLGLTSELLMVAVADLPATDFHLCFSRKWPGHEDLRQRFNAELDALRRSGDYDAIHDRYR